MPRKKKEETVTESVETVEAANETALSEGAVGAAEPVAESVVEPSKPRRGRPPKAHAQAAPAEEVRRAPSWTPAGATPSTRP